MRKIILLVSTILIINIAKSQNSSPVDTIEYARSKAFEKDYSVADKLLTEYNRFHKEVNALRLHAQVLYWMKQFNRSIEVYEKTLSNFPGISVVKLDYGRLLFELGKLKKAQALLNDFITNDSLNVEANIMLSYINMWSGQNKAAKDRANLILKQYPDNKDAISILNQINIYTTPYISAGTNFQSDDQPLTATGFAVETGVYRSWALSPTLQAQYNDFKIPEGKYQSLWIQAGNKISLGIGSTLNVAGGLFQHINSGDSYFTGRIGFTQKISRSFSGEAGFEKKPYQYSIASVRTPVLENVLSLAAGFNKSDNWLGKAGFQRQNFEGNNNINTAYLWLLAPLVKQKNFKVQVGYAFSYAHADKNNFVAAAPLSTLINTTPLYGTVSGIFDPYFTPQNQFINLLLASINIGLSKKVQFSSRTNIGVFAQADNPFLMLEKSTGNQQYYINKGYSTLKYTPIEWVSNLQLNLSPKFSVHLNYTYQKFLFYTNNQGGIQLKYNFIHDQTQ